MLATYMRRMRNSSLEIRIACSSCCPQLVIINNQRLRSAGDNDWRSKRFCSIAVLCVKFHVRDSQNMRDQITSDIRSKRAWLNCVLCILFILNGSPNEHWLHTCDACVITTWRLGFRAPLIARNKSYFGTRPFISLLRFFFEHKAYLPYFL